MTWLVGVAAEYLHVYSICTRVGFWFPDLFVFSDGAMDSGNKEDARIDTYQL